MNLPLIRTGQLLAAWLSRSGAPMLRNSGLRSVEAASTSKLCLGSSCDPSSDSSHSAHSYSSPELLGREPEPGWGPQPARGELDPEPEGFRPPWGGPRACKYPGLDST